MILGRLRTAARLRDILQRYSSQRPARVTPRNHRAGAGRGHGPPSGTPPRRPPPPAPPRPVPRTPCPHACPCFPCPIPLRGRRLRTPGCPGRWPGCPGRWPPWYRRHRIPIPGTLPLPTGYRWGRRRRRWCRAQAAGVRTCGCRDRCGDWVQGWPRRCPARRRWLRSA
jgi:hypothetical protein